MMLRIPTGVDTPLAKRLAGITFFRLVVLSIFLVIIESYYLDEMKFGDFSPMFAVTTAGVAFLATAAYTVFLRLGRHLSAVAYAQLVTDQLIWTAIVYISGGTTSGATSLYGLTCLSGAIVLGLPGAVAAATTALTAYLSLCAGFASGLILPPSDQAPAVYVVQADAMIYPAFSATMAILVATTLGAYLAERLRVFGGHLEAVTKRAERAEHLATLGRLAASLAHEIRNPLGSIRGSIELLRTGRTLSSEDTRLCEIIEQEAERLNDLVGNMVDLARPRAPEKQVMDLAMTAQGVTELASLAAQGHDIKVSYRGPASLRVDADPAQMHQLLWNLVRNAIQASSRGHEVEVAISSDEDGDANLKVADQGCGIDDDIHEQMFEAFFTTRSHGVGLGLAVVKRIVDSHDFSLDVTSSRERGTTFSVNIPKAHKLAALILVITALPNCIPVRDRINPNPQSTAASTEIWWSEDAPPLETEVVEAAEGDDPYEYESPNKKRSPLYSQTPITIKLRGKPGLKTGSYTFRNTYYEFPQEAPYAEHGPTRTIFDINCKPLRTVSQNFYDQVCVQGSGRLHTGETVSFAKRNCNCAATCPRTDQKICFDLLDAKAFPFGRGATGQAITPMRTVAVDSRIVPLGTILYLPHYAGLQTAGGKRHDGCFVAQDQGLRVKGRHIDIFTGSPAATRRWNTAVPSNRGVQVIIGASRCAYLRQR